MKRGIFKVIQMVEALEVVDAMIVKALEIGFH